MKPDRPLVFPVPSSSAVHFRTEFPVVQVHVLDLSGREVLHASGSHSTDGTIDISRLAPGHYIARFEGLGKQAQSMIVRE